MPCSIIQIASYQSCYDTTKTSKILLGFFSQRHPAYCADCIELPGHLTHITVHKGIKSKVEYRTLFKRLLMYKEDRKVTAFFWLPWMYWFCSFSSMVLLEKLLFCHEQCMNYSNSKWHIQEQSEWWQPAHNLVTAISLPSVSEAGTTLQNLEVSQNFSRCLYFENYLFLFS